MPTLSWAHRLCIYLGLGLLAACGDRGTRGSDPPAPPAPTHPVDDLSLRTSTGLSVMNYALKGLPGCSASKVSPPLGPVPTAFAFDGNLDEWSASPGLLLDPSGDAPASSDLTFASLARQGDDLVVAAAWPAGSAVSLELEFGGLVASQEVLRADVRLKLRIDRDELWEFLGDVVTWPAWWLRLTSTSPATGLTSVDRAAAAYFPSLLAADYFPFRFTTCDLWPGQARPFAFFWLQDIPETALGTAPERFNQIARYVFDATSTLLGREAAIPLSSFTVVATVNAVEPPSQEADPAAALYRGLVVDVRYLLPQSEEAFPEGRAFVEVATALLDPYLRQVFPEAPGALVVAVRQALLDALVQQHLGWAYWFDHYWPGILPVLSSLEALKVHPALMASDAAPVPVGHLLSAVLTSSELLSAWKLAALRRPSAGHSLAAFLGSARDQALTETSRAALDRVAAGWLDEREFDADYGPESLLDHDRDGLAEYIEHKFGTVSTQVDSDGDGWSDLAEITLGTDPRAASLGPGVVVSDGVFGDWQNLLPKRLIVDRGRSGLCPKAADITFYAAVVGPKELVLAGVAADFWQDEPAAKWEAVIDFPELKRQLLLTAASGAREFLVKDPSDKTVAEGGRILRRFLRAAPLAQKTLELGFSLDEFGIRIPLDQLDAVKIRLRTVFHDGQEDRVCDETDWFTANRSY